MRTILIWLGAAFVFANLYVMVAQKETERRAGQTVYLELAPVDPRSLLQGDYMALNYAIMNHLNMDHFHHGQPQPDTGRIVIRLDAQNIGEFVRYDDDQPLAPGEHYLKYHHDGWRAEIGAETFFIPEGSGDKYAHATYGELKLAQDGTPILVALCGNDQQRL